MLAVMASRAPVAFARCAAHIGAVTHPADPEAPPSPAAAAAPTQARAAASGIVADVREGVVDGVAHQLDPRYLMLQRRRGWVNAFTYVAMWFILPLVGGGMASVALERAGAPAALEGWLFPLWGIWAIAYTIWCQARVVLAYRHAGYRVDARGIEIRGGIFVRRVISVPRSRVQHIDVVQGPFERRHGIATLSIYTAGVSHAMVSLPGLDHVRALRIRDYLLPHGDDAGH